MVKVFLVAAFLAPVDSCAAFYVPLGILLVVSSGKSNLVLGLAVATPIRMSGWWWWWVICGGLVLESF